MQSYVEVLNKWGLYLILNPLGRIQGGQNLCPIPRSIKFRRKQRHPTRILFQRPREPLIVFHLL